MMLLRLVVMAGVLALCGCSVVDVRDSVTYEHDNKRVPEEVISQIVAGRTTRKWVEEYVGKPDRISTHKNGSEIFTYRFSENRKSRVRVLLLFKYENTGQREKHIYIHFVDGKVYRLWRDYKLPVIPEDMYDFKTIATADDSATLVRSGPSNKRKLFRRQQLEMGASSESAQESLSEPENTVDQQEEKATTKKWWWPFN